MWKDEFKKWKEYTLLDPQLKADLEHKTDSELEEMFYTSLEFGTGGMRGILGAGLNRLNIYTIRKANDGLARYLFKRYGTHELSRGVVIAHDNRRMSREFSIESAKVLGAYGIKSYLFDALRPTPELSFSVRQLHALAGIVVTASHNPPQYNGYKIYDEFGCQYTPEYADEIVGLVNQVDNIFDIKVVEYDHLLNSGLSVVLSGDIDTLYLDMVKTVQFYPKAKKTISIVFTPLHGTSAEIGSRLLTETGYLFYPVKEQMVHDPNFSTVKSPNPENASAFEYAISLGMKKNADILIATDPDADRLGVAVKDGDKYTLLTGNQTGAILIYYLFTQKQKLGLLPEKGVVFNTVVTSDLGAKIAKSFGAEVISTLTGFKYIGEQARFLESTDKTFLFGYEESYGYVINDNVRDKDSLQAMLFCAEAANYYLNEEHKTFVDVLNEIYLKYGYYHEDQKSVDLFGQEGKNKIERIMDFFRNNHLEEVASLKVLSIEDYETSLKYVNGHASKITLPKSNVIKYNLENESWFVLRPSGTEPKLKIYFGGISDSLVGAKLSTVKIIEEVSSLVEKIQ
ncbi:MAG: phospho-sugar mutase [Candidatus Izemoplasmatales bacterium]|jgi:phosphoglucomutase|nr:phospho-sugar mutase [Candidatus Izemoplasmatales bacterium]